MKFWIISTILFLAGSRTLHASSRSKSLLGLISTSIDRPLRYSNNIVLSSDGNYKQTYFDWIEAAKDTVDVSVYTLCNDNFGKALTDLLVKKAFSGVRVRVVVDAFKGTENDYYTKAFRRSPVYFQNYSVIGDKNINDHIHDKVVVIDGKKVLSGGANFCDSYFIPKKTPIANAPTDIPNMYHDFVLAIDGPLAFDFQRRFDQFWNSEASFRNAHDGQYDNVFNADFFAGRTSPSTRRRIHPVFPPTYSDYNEYSGRYPLMEDGSSPASVMMWQRPHMDKMREQYITAYKKIIKASKKEIILYTPYFVLHPEIKNALIERARNGVPVYVFTNSSKHSDLKKYGKLKAMRDYSDFLKAGVRIRETKYRLQHGKTLMIDREVIMVGSNNFTRRSVNHNSENMVATDDLLVINKFVKVILNDVKREYKLISRKNYIRPSNIVDGIIADLYGSLL